MWCDNQGNIPNVIFPKVPEFLTATMAQLKLHFIIFTLRALGEMEILNENTRNSFKWQESLSLI